MPILVRLRGEDAVRCPLEAKDEESCLAAAGRLPASKDPWYGRGDLRGPSGAGTVVGGGDDDSARLSDKSSAGKVEVAGDGMRNSSESD